MALNIQQNGLVQREDSGRVVIVRPGKNGGAVAEIEVPESLADQWNLADGDVVEGGTDPLEIEAEVRANTTLSDECMEDAVFEDEERDEPLTVRRQAIPDWLQFRAMPTDKLTQVHRVNGLEGEDAELRPSARRNRHALERTTPDKLVTLATGPYDATGRTLDLFAPLGRGCAGIIYGPHASGLSRTLRTVIAGVTANAPDMTVLVLLTRARSEEITDWRRRFPAADIVVCPNPQNGAAAKETLRVANLTLACAQRQSELGRDVLLAVDSLTGIWGALLEAEGADAQREADISGARHGLRQWLQKAGNFGGEGLLGAKLGGSITLIGTVWNETIDEEAEEERDVHPHLRLLEHALHETDWRIPLSAALARQRLYPAIDTTRCLSLHESNLFSTDEYESRLQARAALTGLDPMSRYNRLMDTIDAAPDNAALLARLSRST